MSEFNKSYRIKTEIGKDTQLHVKLEQKYDILEIMSLKINQENLYKLHGSNYGVIAGRVLANDAFGIPNAKISVFIPFDNNDINDIINNVLYPYTSTTDKNKNGVRYNLLPNEQLNNCHTNIGSFPEKQFLLDNDNVLEVYEKYYKYTTRTNNAGDYMIFGVPTGNQTVHVDIDLSDVGILSQKPRDMVYKGYNINQFENPNKFKYETNLDSLVQVISQDNSVNVIPFWGDESENTIGITRCDINIHYKFEPTCVFMGSIVTDNKSSYISQKCIPSPTMGAMDELTTGSGTIEMIRKTPNGDVEEFQINGTQLIDGDGVWCYQIPMNLDYMMTDEYGNMIPTNDPKKGIPTRAKVRFRISMQEFDNENTNTFPAKILVPNNPDLINNEEELKIDYQFGSATEDDSFRDLFWNGVYSVKSYIPRIQKGSNWKNEQFTGFKRVNYYGDKNPLPYNNIRISLPFYYQIICALVHLMIRAIGFINRTFKFISSILRGKDVEGNEAPGSYVSLSGSLCDENLDYVCIIPGISIDDLTNISGVSTQDDLLGMTIANHYYELTGELLYKDISYNKITSTNDKKSIHYQNKPEFVIKTSAPATPEKGTKSNTAETINITGITITDKTDYLIQCIEMNLAKQFKVIQFDFYNDWINGLIYIPRWMRLKTKNTQFGDNKIEGKTYACDENFNGSMNIVQQCGLTYKLNDNSIINKIGCNNNGKNLECHKAKNVIKYYKIFNGNGGIVKTVKTIKNQYVYYFKPCDSNNVRLFSTDIILLGTLNDCDKWGIPNTLNELISTTYQMPPNLALTDGDIYGNEYDSGNDNTTSLKLSYSLNNDAKNSKTTLNIGGFSNIKTKNNSISLVSDGDYTVVSGIDWSHLGPMQSVQSELNEDDFDKVTKLYRPGGHFLGLSCSNSETTIKTCVNLSRICEYGVWMSQRQTYPHFTTEGKIDSTYSTVPTGIISKDELSGTNYRRYFSTMNNNRLKTKINNTTGYPIYDFTYLNPINFGGELKDKVYQKDIDKSLLDVITEKKAPELLIPLNLFNRYVTKNGEYIDITNNDIRDRHIMRIGEYKDEEYIKFRFGTTDIKKCFLNTSIDNEYGEVGSFPMYDNSFYFYFGLHNGKTALDKLKENYYANCDKTSLVRQETTYVDIDGLELTNTGVKVDENELNCSSAGYKDNNSGSISFSVKVSDDLVDKYIIASIIKDGNNETIKPTFAENNKYTFSLLSSGYYTINISVGDIVKTLNVYIGSVNMSCELSKNDFYINTDDYGTNVDIFKLNRRSFGGCIIIPNNKIIYDNGNNIDEYDMIESDMINHIEIRINDDEKIINNKNSNEFVYYYKDNGIEKSISILAITDRERNYLIPVPYSDKQYSVYVNTNLTIFGKPTSSESVFCTYSWYLGDVTVNNGKTISFIYNGNSYDVLKQYTSNTKVTDLNGWWNPKAENNWMFESDNFQWNLKRGLYQNSILVPHRVNITNINGLAPYTEIITGVKDDLISTGVTRSDFENVTIPTINYLKNNKRRVNFSYKVKDYNGVETNKFVFPVIYKPFFMEMVLWYINEPDKVFLQGNVYNGITWDYQSEGFNDVKLNGIKVNNLIKITSDDTTMEINESFTSDKGGYDYDGEHFIYNGRKAKAFKELTPEIYGLYANDTMYNFNLSIGSSHTDNNSVYEDKTQMTISKSEMINFKFVGKVIDGKYKVKMIPLNGNNSNYTIKYLIDNKENGYSYPWKGNVLSSDVLFEELFRNNFKNNTTEYKDEFIDTSNYKNTKNVKLYYIAYNNDLDITSSTNENNKMCIISVSNLMNLSEMSNAYTYEIVKSEFDGENMKVGFNFGNEKPVNNLITFKFYNDNNKNYLFSLDSNVSEDITLDLSDYLDILDIDNRNVLYFDYEIYNNKTNERYLYTDNVVTL